ncbi:type II and III secretion system protein [Buttiauxella sp. B2]|uniref:type II and III secretion system protein n=1 Tax=Buttiauxella sp. B2 TaxID=2587812 RepID=UPI00111ED4DF|nr:type II and III secretion system protein [Buttiauxella sp. B2]TNV16099.1 type II and III secretion system protein [Buttiauxella sp. B2]
MKKSTVLKVCCIALGLCLSSLSFAKKIDPTPIRERVSVEDTASSFITYEFTLLKNGEVEANFTQETISSHPTIIEVKNLNRYRKAVIENVSNGKKSLTTTFGDIESGVSVYVLPVVHGNFISTDVKFQFTSFDVAKKLDGIDVPEVSSFKLNTHIFVGSGEVREFKFVVINKEWTKDEYTLLIKTKFYERN